MAKSKTLLHKIRSIWHDTTRSTAGTPRDFKLKDWKNALIETKNAFTSKSIGTLAAGTAYFLTFAVFPAIAAIVAILSIALSNAQIKAVSKAFEEYLPTDIANLLSTQLTAALAHPSSTFLIFLVGIIIALLSLTGATAHMIKATNIIYEVEETRNIANLRLTSLIFVGVGGVIALIVVFLLALNESYLLSIGMPGWLAWVILIARWLVVTAVVTIGLAVFYRYAPNRSNPHWQWVTWGSLIATILWLVATTIFFVYTHYIAHYTESYSVFAGILVLMIWLNLTSFAVLIGATINYKLENQTRARTSH